MYQITVPLSSEGLTNLDPSVYGTLEIDLAPAGSRGGLEKSLSSGKSTALSCN